MRNFETILFGRGLWLQIPLSALCGFGAALAMAPLFYWPLMIIGLGGLYLCQKNCNKPIHAFLCGWIFGFIYFVISLRWIGNALLVEGNEYAWAYPLAISGLPALLAFFPALACYFAKKLTDKNVIHNFVCTIILLCTMEWLRGVVFTGFPWNLYGYAWGDTLEFLQILPLIGAYGLTALTVFWSVLLGAVFIKETKPIHKIAIASFVLISAAGIYSYGALRLNNAEILAPAENLSIKIVQPNIDQADKWKRDKMMDNYESLLSLSSYQSGSDQAGAPSQTTWIIWPETAISFHQLYNQYTKSLLRKMLGAYPHDVYIIGGILLRNEDNDTYSNSIVILDKNAEIIARYDKSHLVPFGEYIPFQKWIPIETVSGFSGFQAGQGITTLELPSGKKISPLICYEILFPGSVVQDNNKPDFIVNVTNDAWYGRSAGPEQHLLKARFRAIEENTPVIRAANTGYSALIDGYGRYVLKTDLFEEKKAEFE